MRSAEERAEMVRQQVKSKVLWGTPDAEVLEWLEERHSVTGEAASELLKEAHGAKRSAVRSKALLQLFLSVAGLLLAFGFVLLQSMGQFVMAGYGSIVILILGIGSAVVLIRSVLRLLSGQAEGSVD